MKDRMKYILILHQLEFEQDCSGIGSNNSCLLAYYNNKVERLQRSTTKLKMFKRHFDSKAIIFRPEDYYNV